MSELVATIKPENPPPELIRFPYLKYVKYENGYIVGYGTQTGGDDIPMAPDRQLLPDLSEVYGHDPTGEEWRLYQQDPDEWRRTHRDQYLATHGNNFPEPDFSSMDPAIADQFRLLNSRVSSLENELVVAHEARSIAEEERDAALAAAAAERHRADALAAEVQRLKSLPVPELQRDRRSAIAAAVGCIVAGAALALGIAAATHAEFDSDAGWKHRIEKQEVKIALLQKDDNSLSRENNTLKAKVARLQTSNGELKAEDQTLKAENTRLKANENAEERSEKASAQTEQASATHQESLEFYGNTIWADVRTNLSSELGYQIRNDDPRISKATRYVLHINGLTWGSARHLPVGFTYRMPNDLVKIVQKS